MRKMDSSYSNPTPKDTRCDRCNQWKKRIFYDWKSGVTGEFLGVICDMCMFKEKFGSKNWNKEYKNK